MNKKLISLLLILLLTASLFCGCGEAPTSTEAPPSESSAIVDTSPVSPKTQTISQIIIGTTSVIETATRDEYAFDMLASGTSEPPLVYQDTNGDYHPLLAEFKTEDAVNWTYTIVNGMKWDDGEPVSAEDILFTLQYEDSAGSANFTDQTDSDGKTTKAIYTGYELSEDKMSITLTLASPNPRALSNMTSFRVMPKHIYEGKDNVSEAEARIGCGPYMFEAFDKNAGTITFTLNPYYPQTPNVEKIVYRIFSNEDTMYMALQSHDIDMTWNYSQGVSATYLDVLSGSDSVTLESVPAGNAPAVLVFNNAEGIFTDKNLRKAVSCALDYNAFKTYFGSTYAQTPNSGFAPPATLGYKDTPALKTDLETAEKYMAEAGYTKKNEDGFYVNADGQVLSFALTVNSGKENHVGYAELVKTNLEALGIKVDLEILDKAAYNAKTSNKFSDNNISMDAAIFGYTSAGMGMGNGLGSIYVDGTHKVQGGAQVFDPAFQEIMTEIQQAKDLEQYKAAAGKLQDFYAEELPIIALYWDNLMYAHSSKYDNVTIDYTFGLSNVINWFTITEK